MTEEIAFLSSNIFHYYREDLAKIPNILVLHFCVLFLLQENFLLNSTLFNINEEEKPCAAEQTQREQEIERATVVAGIIDNGRAHQWPNKSACFADDGEQAEEKKFFAPWCDLRDHGLRIAVPWTDKQAVEDLI